MIIAGEVSGDLHSSGMIRAFTAVDPDVRFFGVGGEEMSAAGCELLFRLDQVAFLGFAEVVRHLPFIRRMMKTLLREAERRKPKAIVLVDYPGFNLRFAAAVRRHPSLKDIPILYYISPQVWAWHASRVPKMARLIDRIAVIFDFEVPLYRNAGLKVDFVGHPLLEVSHPTMTRADFFRLLNLNENQSLLALLPGSRAQEVRRLLPLFTDAAHLLRKTVPSLQAVVGCSPSLDAEFYRSLLSAKGTSDEEIKLVERHTNDLQAHSDIALVASGTATLETAILGTPLVMAYRVSPLTYRIGRRLVKIPHMALVNVVAGKKVVPEFVQGEARPDVIAEELADLLRNDVRRQRMIADLEEVRDRLGEPGASSKVAAILKEMMEPDK
jgi:lipid-A-disaccharide synthase